MTDSELIARFHVGASLEELALSAGVTREAIRLRLERLGEPPRSVAQTRELQFRVRTAGREQEIVTRFLESRNDREVAAQLGLAVSDVQRVVNDRVPDPQVLRKKAVDRQARVFSDEDILGSLRAAASAQSGILAKDHYDSWWHEHQNFNDGRRRPSWQTVLLRFGSWRDGLAAAGLPANPRGGPTKQYDFDDSVAAIVRCWIELGSPPTVTAYDEWSPGRTDVPASATIRKWGSWDELKLDAWQIVHDIRLPNVAPVPEADHAADRTDSQTLGSQYRRANEQSQISAPMSVNVDPTAYERALSSHARLQNAVAAALQERGIDPRSPRGSEPEYDLAFFRGPDPYVVEVKSTTPATLESQLRIGLGQVLRYSEQLGALGPRARPIIAVELDPPDEPWWALLRRLDVFVLRAPSLETDVARLLQGARTGDV